MSLTSFRVGRKDRNKISYWLRNNNLYRYTTYDWISSILTFEREEDAIAFSITFGIIRYETVIEKMLRNEEIE